MVTALTPTPSPDPNRVIAIVTGANSGVGLGLCHRLLHLYSLPSGHVISEALPQATALARNTPDSGPRSVITSGPHLTLVLAVRNRASGEAARTELLGELQTVLAKRDREGLMRVNEWRAALRVEVEVVDFDTPYGEKGILAFTQRIKARHPHVTSVYANAGLYATTGTHWGKLIWEVLTVGPFKAFAYPDNFQSEQMGRMSVDGERGGVWSINVLAPYILTRELLPLLRKSPLAVPTPPRVVYTSSSTSKLSKLDGLAADDTQMIKLPKTYSASKYAGNGIVTELDRVVGVVPKRLGAEEDEEDVGSRGRQEEEGARAVRCLIGEPAIVMTNVARESWRDYPILIPFLAFFQGFTFWLCRLLGSPYHVRDARDAATALLYASLVPERYLPPADAAPRRMFGLVAHPLGDATVVLKEVDGWDAERGDEVVRAQWAACEEMWRAARRREGLEG